MYNLLRPILFKFEAETAHHLTLTALQQTKRFKLLGLIAPRQLNAPYQLMGLTFANRVGLAAGLDKNGDYIEALGELGFGFLEIGTVTPRPQPGNPQPRLFRLPQARAIINRMGFNNKGVDYLVERLKQSRYQGIIGVNIGKNFDTPLEDAASDYLICMNKVYPHASFITVNISSPNTKGLRDLQNAADLGQLVKRLKAEQQQLADTHRRYVPLVVKIAPDLDEGQVSAMAQVFTHYQVDGVIATNTTIGRVGVEGLPHGAEQGGLSGAPLTEQSTRILRQFRQELCHDIPLIGVGGIMSAADAQAKIEAGAELVQLYSGFIYGGPPLVQSVAAAVAN